MSNCKLQPLYFATIKFEVLDEFEGEQGTFIKSFLISDKLNLNDWEVTKQANQLDGPEFKGMPGIEFFNKGRRDHTVGESYEDALRLQSPHSKAIIRRVLGISTGIKLEQISRVFDENMIKKLKQMQKSGKDLFVSPAIFPRSIDDVEIIEKPGGGHIHRVHRYLPLHYAFVDEPAFGPEAKISEICEGKDCLVKLEKARLATDGIGQDDINPLREIPIVRVSRCTKTGKINITVGADKKLNDLVSECLSKKLGEGEEPTDKDIAICISEARKLLKSNTSKIPQSKSYGKKLANEEVTKEEMDKLNARLSAIEENEKEKEKEAKKAKAKKANETEPNHEEDMLESVEDIPENETEKEKEARKKAKKAKGKKGVDEETEKEKEQTAKIASMDKIINNEIKMPKIAKYLEYRASVGDSEEVLEAKKAKLLKASMDEIDEKLADVEPHIASLQFNKEVKQESGSTKFPMGLGVEQLSASTKTAEEMYDEVYS